MGTVERSVLEIREEAGVLHAVMHNPPVNAFGDDLVAELTALVDAFDDSDAKVLLLSSGVAGFFAAGADLDLLSRVNSEGLADYRDAVRRPLARLAASRRPSIAVIEGSALGGGLELALACTVRVCTPDARLAFPEIKLGLVPGAGGTQRLPRHVGAGRAAELLLTGREISGEEAVRIGLVEVLAADALASGSDVAAAIARASAPAITAILTCIDAALGMPLEQGMSVEAAALLSTFEDGEGREGIDAFRQRRRARFA